jgi:hypothetical protein
MSASEKPKVSSAKEPLPNNKEVSSSNNSTLEPFKTWEDVIKRDIPCEEKFALLKKNSKLLQTKLKERNL